MELISAGSKTVQSRLEDGIDIPRVAVDLGHGHHHVGDLFEREVVTNFVGALGRLEEWPTGSQHPGPALAQQGVAAIGALE